MRYTWYLLLTGARVAAPQPTLLTAVKVPRNQTAAMQLLQLYVQTGHFYWTTGVVLRSKLRRFIEKLASFRIERDAPGRAYDKTKNIASTHLVLLDSPDDALVWILVSSLGRYGLADDESPKLETVKDTRLAGQHLTFKHYELLHLEKHIMRIRDIKTKQGKMLKDRQETIRQTTWTWRMTGARMREHEAFIVALAKQRDSDSLAAELGALAMMPMFSGVRGQVLKLYAEAKKLTVKFKLDPISLPMLPVMVKLPIYDTPSKSLLNIATTSVSVN